MKFLFYISIAIFLIFSCKSEPSNSSSDQATQPMFPPHIQKKVRHIKYLDTVSFAKVNASILAISKKEFEKTNPSENKLLSEKFCKKSKGYQNETWEGKNDCSWAVETNNLERFEGRVKRMGDTLVLKLNNGEDIEFTHDFSNPQQVLYYQFKNYLKEIDFFVVEAIQKDNCRESILINAKDGVNFQINGILFFSNDQKTFLSASFDNELPLNCTNKIEMYKFSNGQIEKLWHIPTGNWGVTEAKFINQMDFLLEQSTTGIPSEYKRYAKVSTIKQSPQ